MKKTKGGKIMNPTDAYRKELRKKELKRNKKERKKVREVGILKKDPETIREQIQKLEMMKADGALDKARKHKKRQLEDTLNLVLKKKKEYEDKMREKGEVPVMFSHLGPLRKQATIEEQERARHPKPEDSVYYHPTLNPTGAPPPGKPPMYKSSIGPKIPVAGSSSAGASSLMSDSEEAAMGVPPPPPPPPPLPESSMAVDDSAGPSSLPFPPPLPPPPKPIADTNGSLPPPPYPPPPPGPPPKEALVHVSRPPPPPPPIQRPLQPPPPGTGGRDTEDEKGVASESLEVGKGTALHPPPPPPALPPKPVNQQADATPSESNVYSATGENDMSKMTTLLPPPPRLPPPPPLPGRLPIMPPSQSEMMPPGIARFPTPPDMRQSMPVPGLLSRPPPPPPPGMAPPPMPGAPFIAPPGQALLRPPLPPFFPQEDDLTSYRPVAPLKPSYVKSAAPTVVKRPLAQHTPELTAMVPASVRVRRETAHPKTKTKSQLFAVTSAPKPSASVMVGKSDVVITSSAPPKVQSIDDSYTAFMEDMKALGALDG